MKKFISLFLLFYIVNSPSMFSSIHDGETFVTSDDWTYGTASFDGSRPSNSKSIGGVTVYYNGDLKNTKSVGGVDYWEGTGDICVIYPKNYTGRELKFISRGGTVQIQYLK